jgi:hypothetical protein
MRSSSNKVYSGGVAQCWDGLTERLAHVHARSGFQCHHQYSSGRECRVVSSPATIETSHCALKCTITSDINACSCVLSLNFLLYSAI